MSQHVDFKAWFLVRSVVVEFRKRSLSVSTRMLGEYSVDVMF